MFSKTVKVALINMNSHLDMPANLAKASSYIAEAALQGAKWIVLPEMFPYLGPAKNFWGISEEENGSLYQKLSQLALRHKVTLFSGSVCERLYQTKRDKKQELGKKVYNTCYILGPNGELIEKYRKINLFKFSSEIQKIDETKSFLAGNRLCVFNYGVWKIGLVICFDLRFPALFERLKNKLGSLDVCIIPAAFTKETGMKHWEILLRARAIENQCYILAANQTGQHYPGRESYGHSLAVNPDGEVVASAKFKEEIIYATLDYNSVENMSTMIPLDLSVRR